MKKVMRVLWDELKGDPKGLWQDFLVFWSRYSLWILGAVAVVILLLLPGEGMERQATDIPW